MAEKTKPSSRDKSARSERTSKPSILRKSEDVANRKLAAKRWKRKKKSKCCDSADGRKPIDASITLKGSDRGATLLVDIFAEQACGIAHIDVTIAITDATGSWSKDAINQDYTCNPPEYPKGISRQWYFSAGAKKGMGDSRYGGKLPVADIVCLQVFAIMNVRDCCGHEVTKEALLDYVLV